MTYNDNEKYINEAWIKTKEDKAFVTSFLKSLLEQWQHHGNGLDADMVDGMHWSEDGIKEEQPYIKTFILNLTKDFLKEFSIGRTVFSSKNDFTNYIIGFDGIKLYNNQAEGYTENETLLPWKRSDLATLKAETGAISLAGVFAQLYNETSFQNSEGKTNKQVFDAFVNQFESYRNALNILKDRVKDGRLDADSVNGITFYIKTPQQYAAIKENARLYDTYGKLYDPDNEETFQYEEYAQETYEKDSKIFNSVQSVFIIKSEQEIKDGGFPDGYYTGNPDIAIINRYYKFKIQDKDVLDENTGEIKTEPWLQYCYDDEGKSEDQLIWHDVGPAADFIDNRIVRNLLVNILENDTGYEFNIIPFAKAFSKIIFTDDTSPKLNTYLDGKYIRGGVYTSDNQVKQVTIVTADDGSRKLDLTELVNGLISKINQVNTSLSSAIQNQETRVNNLDIDLGELQSKFDALTRGSSITLKGIETRLDEIDGSEGRLNQLGASITEHSNRHGWINYSADHQDNDFIKDTGAHIWYNKALQLCFIRCSVELKESNKWKSVSTKPLPNLMKPIWTTPLFVLDEDGFDTIAKVVDDDSSNSPARLRYYTKKNINSKNKDIIVEGFYIYTTKYWTDH